MIVLLVHIIGLVVGGLRQSGCHVPSSRGNALVLSPLSAGFYIDSFRSIS